MAIRIVLTSSDMLSIEFLRVSKSASLSLMFEIYLDTFMNYYLAVLYSLYSFWTAFLLRFLLYLAILSLYAALRHLAASSLSASLA